MPVRLADFLPDWIAAHPRLMTGAAVGALVASLVTWQLGGFRAVPPAPVATYGAGATIVTNEWVLRPERAWIADRDPGGRRAPAGGAMLVVELIAENRTQRSSGSVTQALQLLGETDDPGDDATVRPGSTPALVLMRDPSVGAIVHPGLPERLAASWELPPPLTISTHARLRVIGRDWVERDSLVGGSGWMRNHPVGELLLPVDDRRTPVANQGGGAP